MPQPGEPLEQQSGVIGRRNPQEVYAVGRLGLETEIMVRRKL